MSISAAAAFRRLVLRGKIGAASASWFRERLDEAKLRAGDAVVISSLGGDVGQSLIMGEVIRTRGLVTAVGTVDASGRVGPASCASACVFVFAGGKTRFGVEGSRLGVHRFTTKTASADPVADAQRVTGTMLSYLTKMGISASVFVEAMSRTGDIRWLEYPGGGVDEPHHRSPCASPERAWPLPPLAVNLDFSPHAKPPGGLRQIIATERIL